MKVVSKPFPMVANCYHYFSYMFAQQGGYYCEHLCFGAGLVKHVGLQLQTAFSIGRVVEFLHHDGFFLWER